MNSPLGDFWRVNSYGYPNPFSSGEKSLQAWETLLTFFDNPSYSQLKRYWSSTKAPRQISPHGVESWKAAFEEFGLLYVLTGSDEVCITPAGTQFRDAGQNQQNREFAWIGLSLLLRYPLKGARRPKSESHARSDLLIYWFLYAAFRELQNYLWRSEIDRILCRVFNVAEAESAISTIQELRSGHARLDDYIMPSQAERGAFYNSINQVLVHAGLNYLLFEKSSDDSFYDTVPNEQKIWIPNDWVPIIDLALGGTSLFHDCEEQTRFISRMPRAPGTFSSEEAYFEYLGSKVDPMPDISTQAGLQEISLDGNMVGILENNEHYQVMNANKIKGTITNLCKLAKGQRIILSHDLKWSYIIEDKQRAPHNQIELTVRRGRPIVNSQPIISILRTEHE